jgi:hypothetical protein
MPPLWRAPLGGCTFGPDVAEIRRKVETPPRATTGSPADPVVPTREPQPIDPPKAEMPPVMSAESARPKLGRPSDPRWRGPDGTFDMTTYQREYQRQRRAAAKAAKAESVSSSGSRSR